MWEAAAEIETAASPQAVWGLWANPARWADWNDRIAAAELDGPLVEGARARIRFRHSPRALDFAVTRLERGRVFVDETRLPGVVMGHEHRVERRDGRTVIRNRLYIRGPAARVWAALMGRGMRASVRRFVQRERELAEAADPTTRPGRSPAAAETPGPVGRW